jgi:hypothetical protein
MQDGQRAKPKKLRITTRIKCSTAKDFYVKLRLTMGAGERQPRGQGILR